MHWEVNSPKSSGNNRAIKTKYLKDSLKKIREIMIMKKLLVKLCRYEIDGFIIVITVIEIKAKLK